MKPVFFLPASQPMGPHGTVSAFSPPPGSPGRALSWPSQERTAEATPKSLSLFSRAPRTPMACHGLSNRPRFPTGRHGLTRNAYGMRARSSQPGWERGTARGARMRRFRACGGFSFEALSHRARGCNSENAGIATHKRKNHEIEIKISFFALSTLNI